MSDICNNQEKKSEEVIRVWRAPEVERREKEEKR